jgi:hypothetical protein
VDQGHVFKEWGCDVRQVLLKRDTVSNGISYVIAHCSSDIIPYKIPDKISYAETHEIAHSFSDFIAYARAMH